MGVFIWFFIQVWPPSSNGEAIAVGLVWLVLTVVFEFSMGLVLLNRPMAQLLADYDWRAGRVWLLFLIWLMVAPWLFFLLKNV